MRHLSLIGLVLSLIFFIGCGKTAPEDTLQSTTIPPVTILIDANGPETDYITAQDLRDDLLKLGKPSVSLRAWQQELPTDTTLIAVGTAGQHGLVDQLISAGSLALSTTTPGPRGGIWSKQRYQQRDVLVLAGSDIQGTQYATYDYSRDVLGLDPLQYWTGTELIQQPTLDLLAIDEQTIAPPQMPYMIYFENDVDELANMKKPYLEYDWENYKQLVDALVRLRYNGIEYFDMLGRQEYYTRAGYKAIRPDYELNMSLLEKMFDYAHKKGMLIQVDMMMGRPFGSITFEESNCWTQYQDRWRETWTHYLTNTPLKDADIYIMRPRNQTLDWSYKSSCGENRAQVFNEAFAALGELVDRYRPGSTKVCICYHDGMEIYNEGFRPPKDWIIAWSDDGWGDFEFQPEGPIEHDFGTYMHAGFWLNHDVHDPYPNVVEEVMQDFVHRYNADKYILVNGQTFRLFLLNLEAYAQLATNVQAFDGDAFYRQWVSRYFGEHVVETTVHSLKKLHETQFGHSGYVEHLWETKMAVAYLKGKDIERPDKSPIPMPWDKVEAVIPKIKQRVTLIHEAMTAAEKGMSQAPNNAMFYHDHIVLPTVLYRDLISYNDTLFTLAALKAAYLDSRDDALKAQAEPLFDQASKQLARILANRIAGDQNPQWQGWYHPDKRRPNNGFPSQDDLNDIKDTFTKGW